MAGEDLALAVQGQVIVILGDQDVREQAGAGHAARDRARWCRRLHDPLALPAGLLEPRGLDHLQLRGDEFKDLRHVLVHQAQRAAAVRAAFARVEHDALARRRCGDPRLATPARRGAFGWRLGGCRSLRWFGLGLRRGHRHLEVFERELQLVDLPLDLFGARPELLPLELGDADLERLDQRLVGPHRRRHPLGLVRCPARSRSRAPGLHRRNRDVDQDGPHVWPRAQGRALPRPGPARPLEDHDLRRRRSRSTASSRP